MVMDIKLSRKDKKFITGSDDVYGIMQRILLSDNKIDREKEHFWIIGLNLAGYILYVELVSLGGVRATVVEPMNVFRVAVMKNATRVIAVHNHPSGNLAPSEDDLNLTDRLIQVGKILDIKMDDHLIITPTDYMSFRAAGLMDELEKSLRYVPTYQVIEQIRKEEKAIAKEAILTEKQKTLTAKQLAKTEREQRQKSEKLLFSAINFLLEKEIAVEQIAVILNITSKDVQRILKKKIS